MGRLASFRYIGRVRDPAGRTGGWLRHASTAWSGSRSFRGDASHNAVGIPTFSERRKLPPLAMLGVFGVLGCPILLHRESSQCEGLQGKPDEFVESYSRIACGYHMGQEDPKNDSSFIPSADITWATRPEQADRMAILQVNANPVLEDRAVIQELHTVANGTLLFGAVIDGHGGWQVAEYVQRKLPGYVERSINEACSSKDPETPLNCTEIGEAIRSAFVQLDNDMMSRVQGTVEMGLSRTAKVGACCAAVVVTPEAVITANSGDCRVIFATPSNSVESLTSSHSANEPSERKRLQEEHPDEPDIVVCKKSFHVPNSPQRWIEYPVQWLGLLGHAIEQSSCYVKGRLQPTRSFGDFYLKREEFSYDFETDSPFFRDAKSFPYITAVPEVRIYPRDTALRLGQYQRQSRPFLVLASDGVWDFLSPQEVVTTAREGLQVSVQDAARRVIRAVLSTAAKESGFSVADLALLNPKDKRRVYDDTTVCIIMLDTV